MRAAVASIRSLEIAAGRKKGVSRGKDVSRESPTVVDQYSELLISRYVACSKRKMRISMSRGLKKLNALARVLSNTTFLGAQMSHKQLPDNPTAKKIV